MQSVSCRFDFSKEQTLLSLENLTAFSSRCFALGNNISGIGTITGTVEENASRSFWNTCK